MRVSIVYGFVQTFYNRFCPQKCVAGRCIYIVSTTRGMGPEGYGLVLGDGLKSGKEAEQILVFIDMNSG